MSVFKVPLYVTVICCGLLYSPVIYSQEPTSADLQITGMTAITAGSVVGFTIQFQSERFSNRILLQQSSDLELWSDVPDFLKLVNGAKVLIDYVTSERSFYRGRIALPEIKTVFQDIELMSGVISGDIPFIISDPAYLEEQLQVTIASGNQSTVPDGNITLSGEGANRSMTILPTVEGTEPAFITVTVTAPDGISVEAGFMVTSLGGSGFALTLEEFSNRVVGKLFTGELYNFRSETRFDWNGEFGNWSYQPVDGTTATLVFTYDEDNNNPAVYRETYTLTYNTSHSGDFEFKEIVNEVVTSNAFGFFDLDAFTELPSGNSLSPSEFSDMVVGKTFISPAYKIDSTTRFTYNDGVAEPGNWTYNQTGADTATMILTYDEDGNNAAVYREEVLLTYVTPTTGTYLYREYDGGFLTTTSSGSFDLEQG